MKKVKEGLDMRETESFSTFLSLSPILKTDSITPPPPHPPYPYLKSPLKVQYYDTALLEVRTSGPLTIPISKGSLGGF